MRKKSPISGTAVQDSSEAKGEGEGATTLGSAEQEAGDRVPAAQGLILDPASAAENSAAPMPVDSPAEALGRQTLSTAFVMVDPDGYLTVEMRDGRQMVLRNVIMRRKDYCGGLVLNGLASKRYCGRYANIAAARPGGAPVLEDSSITISNPVASSSIPANSMKVIPRIPKKPRLGECLSKTVSALAYLGSRAVPPAAIIPGAGLLRRVREAGYDASEIRPNIKVTSASPRSLPSV